MTDQYDDDDELPARDVECDPLFERLREAVVHSTSLDAFRAIYRDKMVKPSGQEPPAWHSYAGNMHSEHIGAVAVFDFSSCNNDQIRSVRAQTEQVLLHHRPLTVLLLLDSVPLRPNADGIRSRDEYKRKVQVIPHVEAWHVGPLPLSKIRTALIIRREPLRYAEVSLDDLASHPWQHLASTQWPDLPLPLTIREHLDARIAATEGTYLSTVLRRLRDDDTSP